MYNSEEEKWNKRREAEHRRQIEKERAQEQKRKDALLDARFREYKRRAMTPGEKISEDVFYTLISIGLLLAACYGAYWLVMNVRC